MYPVPVPPGAGMPVSAPAPVPGVSLNNNWGRSNPGFYLPANGHTHDGAKDGDMVREARNKAEKSRRDKITGFIIEIYKLLGGMYNFGAKKVDKTSVLRLGVSFIRLDRAMNHGQSKITTPPGFDHVNILERCLEEIDGIVFIIHSNGNIIFVSDGVEKTLGYKPIDLTGTPIFHIASLEDQQMLRKVLEADTDPNAICDRMIIGSDDSSSADTATSASCSSEQSSPTAEPSSSPPHASASSDPDAPPIFQERQFFVHLQERLVSRGDHPQYVLMNAFGHLRINSKSSPVLVVVMQPFRKQNLHLETNFLPDDEYITRHVLDGLIIYTDQRIGLITGYLPSEVIGNSAFNYIHKEDLVCTMLSLGQMFRWGEAYGSSCYRLRTKTGDYVYLKTYGYVEKYGDTKSLICVNVHVPKEEGEKAIAAMKARFYPTSSNGGSKSGGAIITEVFEGASPLPLEDGMPESPSASAESIPTLVNNILLANLNGEQPNASPSANITNEHYAKITIASMKLPPATVQAAQIGLKDTPGSLNSSRTPSASPSARSPQSENMRRPSVVQTVGSVYPNATRNNKRGHEVNQDDDPKRIRRDSTPVSVVTRTSVGVGVPVQSHTNVYAPTDLPNGEGGQSGSPKHSWMTMTDLDPFDRFSPDLSSMPNYPSPEDNGLDPRVSQQLPTQQSMQSEELEHQVHQQLIVSQISLGSNHQDQVDRMTNLGIPHDHTDRCDTQHRRVLGFGGRARSFKEETL